MRYPTSRSGLALPIQEVGYEVVAHQRRLTNRHHLQFDRTDYMKSPLHRVFRGLSSRVVDMNMADHIELHDRFNAPRFPTDTQMIDCLEEYICTNGVIECVREKKTHQIYEINLEQWLHIRDRSGHAYITV
jgi:hypothetical protein